MELERYFIKQLDELKKENERLKKENQEKDNKFLVLEERPQAKVELIADDALLRILEENNIDLNYIVEEMGVKEVQELIKDLCLYREAKNDNYVAIVKINNLFYGLEKYYDEYKVKPNVYVDLDDAIYYDLTDKFYDVVSSEITRRKQTKVGTEQKEED